MFFVLSCLIILVLFETGSRIYEYSQPDCYLIGAQATKDLGMTLQKEMCLEFYKINATEYPVYSLEPNQHFTTININNLGFRGSDFELKKSEDVYRIFMVGGSTVFGAGSSSDETTIPAFLEKEFHKNNYNVEIINAGVSAADSFEEAYKIKHIYKKFEPDLFLIYDGWNDSLGKIRSGELDPEISRHDYVESEKNIVRLLIRDYLSEYRTPYVLYPVFEEFFTAQIMTNEVMEKNSEIWSSRWYDVCNENNDDDIKTIILLQPIVGTGNKELSSDEKYRAKSIEQIKSIEQLEYYGKKLPISSCNLSIDLRNTFDDVSVPIYYDGGHMGDLGNEIVAKKIYEKIIPTILEDLSY